MKYAIGVDIGGTTVKGALFDKNHTIVGEFSSPTNGKAGREAIFSALFLVLDNLYQEGAEIGISSAGDINPYTGECVYATDNLMGWTGTKIKAAVEERYHVRCEVDNDAVCALKGELSFYPHLKNVTMLTFGTGVGGASLVNGEILRGKKFNAGRWGHVNLYPNGRVCSCGRRGCAEAYLSASALLARGQEVIPSLKSCKELFERYAAGEKQAVSLLQAFGAELTILLNDIRTTLAPELILLGGGVMQSEKIVSELLNAPTDIAFAKLSSRAGVYGAVSLLKK